MTLETQLPPRRMCPGCDSAMQPFFAGVVEIDRCNFCGGTWLDGGELEAVLGAPVPCEALGGATTRRCAGCRLTLETVTVRGTPVERCGSCHGLYLDQDELAELAGRQVPLTATGRHAPPTREAITFRCALCGDHLPYENGVTTVGGFSCPGCVPMLEASHAPVAVNHAWGRRRSYRDSVSESDVVHALSDFFMGR